MSTEKHDPWALLAEIHELQPWLSQDADLAARVESALAEHDAVPPSEEPVWHMTGGPIGTLTADLGDWVLRVRWDGQDAAWDATRYGRESDEKRAKSAAIAAARGTK